MTQIKNFILLFFVAFSTLAACAERITVDVQTAGTLGQLLEGKAGITALTVTGDLNETDMVVIHNLCDNNAVDEVNLADANFADSRLPDRSFAYEYPGDDSDESKWHGPRRIILPNGLKIIGEKGIWACGVKEIVIKEGLEKIESCGVAQTLITNITLPSSCTCFEKGALYSNRQLTSLAIPEGTTQLPEMFALRCSNLNRLELPSSLEKIDRRAFMATKIQHIFIPEGVKRVEEEAFFHCPSDKIVLPVSIEYLGLRAFADLRCDVYCAASTLPQCEVLFHENLVADYGLKAAYETPFDRGILGIILNAPAKSRNNATYYESWIANSTLYVPLGCTELYRSNPGFYPFGNIVETDNFPASLKDISSVGDEPTVITLNGRTLKIGITEGFSAPYQIYALDGRMVASGIAVADVYLTLPSTGIYVIRAGAKTTKVAVM